jgi:hypothetical protein
VRVFDDDLVAHLHSGCALIVATVSADNVPRAARAWGLTVVASDPPTLRLLLDATDAGTLANVAGGGAIAITTASVVTLHSLQFKGHVVGTEPATAEDDAKAAQYRDDFFADVIETDGMPRSPLERWAADQVVACTVVVTEHYSQTPGPTAGSQLAVRTRT